jgi:hypothetical protein
MRRLLVLVSALDAVTGFSARAGRGAPGRAARRLGFVMAVAGVSLVVASPAFSVYGPVLSGTGTATVDGVMGQSEWAGAATSEATMLVNYPGFPGVGELSVMNDARTLYLGLRIPAPPSEFGLGGGIGLHFDDNNNGVLDESGDDVLGMGFVGPDQIRATDGVELPCQDCGLLGLWDVADTDNGGTNDVVAATSYDAGFVTIEVAHPLDSHDPNDIDLEAGDVGINFGFVLFGPLGSVQGYWQGTIHAAGTFDVTPPTLTLPPTTVVDATGPAGAIVAYAATASDLVDPSPSVVCSPASGAEFSIGDTTVSCSATDAAGNVATGSFDVHVRGASEETSALIDRVLAIDAKQGIVKSLDAKLGAVQQALAAANAGNRADASNTLAAFVNDVDAQAGKGLTGAQASQLIAAAQQIQAVLG